MSHIDNEFYKQLKETMSMPISDRSLENATKALRDALQTTLTDSMKEIHQTACSIERTNLPSKSEVMQLRQAYVDLLWKSRSIAGLAKSAANDFAGDMLDLIMMPEVSSSDKISELVRWNNRIVANGKDAIAQPKQFQALVLKIHAYADKIKIEVGNKSSEASTKLKNLRKDIASNNTKSDRYPTSYAPRPFSVSTVWLRVTFLEVTPIAANLKVKSGGFIGILSASPQAAFTAILTAVKLGVPELRGFNSQLNNVDTQRREFAAWRDALQQQVNSLEADQAKLGDASIIPSVLRDIADNIDDFAKRMTAFTDVFTPLSLDQGEIQQILQQNIPLTDPAFKDHVDVSKRTLAILSKNLDIYSKAPTTNV
ncbi:hypothetical protein K474DRAFT_1709995 [Panus rudis PR-1116 ss-1]|nr:hypothetical protein K474DRAFT_1709995 [Panus rudis PR-1116 ss-1]